MTETERMLAGKMYDPCKTENNSWAEVRSACKKFNDSEFWIDKTPFEELKKCFANAPEDMVLVPPFYCEHGSRISFGKHFKADTGLTILDENNVTFGDNVFVGPNVTISTVNRPIAKAVREMDIQIAQPVTIGNDVWIGANVVINPGVTIGDDVVIAAGSVVTQNISDHSMVEGNPCKCIRSITYADHYNWMERYEEYQKEITQ